MPDTDEHSQHTWAYAGTHSTTQTRRTLHNTTSTDSGACTLGFGDCGGPGRAIDLPALLLSLAAFTIKVPVAGAGAFVTSFVSFASTTLGWFAVHPLRRPLRVPVLDCECVRCWPKACQ